MTARLSQKRMNAVVEPQATRPYVPGYGIPTSRKGMLPWAHATRRLSRSLHYWVSTTWPDGRPHAMPVWGVWVDGAVCFGGGETRWSKNLTSNPAVVVHLEKGDDVVILEGVAERVTDPDDPLVPRVQDAYQAKYKMRHPPPFWAVRPRIAFAWHKDLKTATRWKFGG